MKIIFLKTASVLCAFSMFLASCGGDSPSGAGNNTINLLNNSSFENSSNQPDFSGWISSEYFTDSLGNRSAPLVQDSPSDGGGKWSVLLWPGWLPEEGYAENIITGQSGTNIYKVSTWIKTNGWRGKISLKQYKNGILVHDKFIYDTTHIWKQISFIDTLTVQQTDSLRIHLSAGATELSAGKVWFDNVKLEKVN